MSGSQRAQPARPLAVLVGPPGAGKSTVGRLVAHALHAPFCDVDAVIEAEAGKPISEIFIDDGEPTFRRQEEDAIATALASQTGVVALGGGAVLSATTRQSLAPHRVVWLQVGFAAAAQRVGMAASRPVLALNPRAALRTLLAERDPLYAEVASIRVATDGRAPREVASEIVAQLNDEPAASESKLGQSAQHENPPLLSGEGTVR